MEVKKGPVTGRYYVVVYRTSAIIFDKEGKPWLQFHITESQDQVSQGQEDKLTDLVDVLNQKVTVEGTKNL